MMLRHKHKEPRPVKKNLETFKTPSRNLSLLLESSLLWWLELFLVSLLESKEDTVSENKMNAKVCKVFVFLNLSQEDSCLYKTAL